MKNEKETFDLVDLKSTSQANVKKVFIETYGCQMNVADSEVVASIMNMAGYEMTEHLDEADAIFVNTCSVRDNAEQKVLGRLQYFHSLRKKKKSLIIGVLGCMAERVKEDLIKEHHVDLVAGPDSYMDLPNLVGAVENGEKAINVTLSTQETYKDVMPLKLPGLHISGFVSIMRGCNNFCSYCIVPYTRGRERSRDVESILNEIRDMRDKGFKEVTLLGQNVNSYLYEKEGVSVNFPKLLELVAQEAPNMRVRFMTSHPKDMSDETLKVIAAHDNICKFIHLPAHNQPPQEHGRVLLLPGRIVARYPLPILVDAICFNGHRVTCIITFLNNSHRIHVFNHQLITTGAQQRYRVVFSIATLVDLFQFSGFQIQPADRVLRPSGLRLCFFHTEEQVLRVTHHAISGKSLIAVQLQHLPPVLSVQVHLQQFFGIPIGTANHIQFVIQYELRVPTDRQPGGTGIITVGAVGLAAQWYTDLRFVINKCQNLRPVQQSAADIRAVFCPRLTEILVTAH